MPTPRPSRPTPTTLIALLRGINVGGKNLLPMRDLAALFAAAGCADVRTYIQSGNVIFTAPPSRSAADPAATLAPILTQAIADRFGLKVPVILRTPADLARIAADNPYLKARPCLKAGPVLNAGPDPATLHIAFLASTPDKRRAASLDPDRSPGDSFTLRAQEIYLHIPNGAAKTKLTNAYFDSTLATISSARNWRTVLKLLEMATPS